MDVRRIRIVVEHGDPSGEIGPELKAGLRVEIGLCSGVDSHDVLDVKL